ncbi:tetratricopeptide repeat protein [Sandaracinus amylolyticus]|uniref:tetratricopeptide repeat protein n=1 Tax=Sandaracinus amylolyticus TaxID=927083 RepID=UPI001F17D762|nr:tetratricopeptide repeat protein [Sandaracinus amylolyticus]UJR78369.1 Hypothetical protein I5071_3960 [Sandaracinus amylolyticus]
MSAQAEAAPTYVLWLGDDVGALHRELAVRGVQIVKAPAAMAAREIAALAPDLVVLGASAIERAESLAAELDAERPVSPPPLVVLEPGIDTELERRYGVVASLDSTIAMSQLAPRIEGLLAKLGSSHGLWSLSLAPRELEGFAARAREDRRAGVLLCGSPPAAIAMTAEGSCAPSLASFVERTSTSESLTLRFYERAPGRLAVLGADAKPDDTKRRASTRLDGLAVVVIEGGGGSWSAVAEALRDIGANARVVTARKDALEEARTADPAAIVVPTAALATPAGRTILEDPRLSSAALVVVAPERLARSGTGLVVATVIDACAHELAIRERSLGEPLIDRVETLGPARWLKTLARSEAAVRMRVRGPSGEGELVLASGRIKDASFTPRDRAASPLQGAAAVRAVVATSYGTLLANRADTPPHERAPLRAASPMPAAKRPMPQAAIPAPRAGVVAPRPAAVASPPARAAIANGAAPAPQRAAAAARIDAIAPSVDAGAIEHEERTAIAGDEVVRAKVAESVRVDEPPARDSIGSRITRPAPIDDDEDDEPTMLAVRPASLAALASDPKPATEPEPASSATTSEELTTIAIGAIEADAPPAPPSTPEPIPAPSIELPVAPSVPAPRPRSRVPLIALAASIAIGLGVGAWTMRDRLFAHAPDAPVADAPIPTVAAPPAPSEPDTEDPAVAEAPPTEIAEAPPTEIATTAPPTEGPIVDARGAARIVLEADRAMRARQYQRALELADQALALDPTNARAFYDHAVAVLRLGRDAEALEWAERGTRVDRAEPLFWLLIGDIHQQNGRRVRARDAWERCLQVEAGQSSCARRLGTETAATPSTTPSEPAPE